MTQSNPEPASDLSSPSDSTFNLSLRQIIFLALSLVGLVLLCVFGFLLIDPLGLIDSPDEELADAVPTEASGTPAPTPDLQTDDVIVVFDGSSTLSIDLDPPVSIVINNRPFRVNTEFVSTDIPWSSPDLPSSEAEWVFGTIINQVFGLSPDQESQVLLDQLVPGDRVIVTYQSGDTKEFVVTGRELAVPSEIPLFEQNRPGMKLVWLGGDSESRLIVSGDFRLPETTVNNNEAVTAVQVGETAQIGDVRLGVLGTQIVVNDPTIPPGFSLFVVDFEIENVGNQVLDTGLWRFVLADDAGTQYSLNLSSGQVSQYPLLSGSLSGGAVRQASAIYQIPLNLNSSGLEWRVSRADAPGQVLVDIPFNQDLGGDVQVSINRAEVSLDGSSLLISGELVNNSGFPLVINEQDVSLLGDQTNYLVFSTTPAFPWTVAGGSSAPFSLSFQRPTSNDATFTILDKSFELTEFR